MRRIFLALALSAAVPAAAAPSDDLRAVIDQHWAWYLRNNPVQATTLGVRTYDAEIGDVSLAQHCAAWQQLPFVALDTEFMRVDTFYPIAGLLQVGDGERAYLIDPLLIRDWQPFAALLENPALLKVLHACSEDLEVLLRLTGSLPAPLFDTQLAAAYLNLGFSMGYSRLVQAVLGIELPKGETRSDWLQRPLSETQVSYAAEDAVHLAEVYRQLAPQLSAEKTAAVLEDGAELISNMRREVLPEGLGDHLLGPVQVLARVHEVGSGLHGFGAADSAQNVGHRVGMGQDVFARVQRFGRQQRLGESASAGQRLRLMGQTRGGGGHDGRGHWGGRAGGAGGLGVGRI